MTYFGIAGGRKSSFSENFSMRSIAPQRDEIRTRGNPRRACEAAGNARGAWLTPRQYDSTSPPSGRIRSSRSSPGSRPHPIGSSYPRASDMRMLTVRKAEFAHSSGSLSCLPSRSRHKDTRQIADVRKRFSEIQVTHAHPHPDIRARHDGAASPALAAQTSAGAFAHLSNHRFGFERQGRDRTTGPRAGRLHACAREATGKTAFSAARDLRIGHMMESKESEGEGAQTATP